uniref:Uncharacterized protein n=1 Tax=Avena sativa TaxID=4498 RepID=A0ACD5X684_AVESA
METLLSLRIESSPDRQRVSLSEQHTYTATTKRSWQRALSSNNRRSSASSTSRGMALRCVTATATAVSPCLLLRHHRALSRLPFRRKPCALAAGARWTTCGARRRVRYEEEDEDEEEEYGHNEEMARLEAYSEGARGQALLVKATVDGETEVVLVFKGFSSNLSGRTAPDPAMSVLPERAIIQSVDVVEGPFDPANIEYLEKDVSWGEFKTRLQ